MPCLEKVGPHSNYIQLQQLSLDRVERTVPVNPSFQSRKSKLLHCVLVILV